MSRSALSNLFLGGGICVGIYSILSDGVGGTNFSGSALLNHHHQHHH